MSCHIFTLKWPLFTALLVRIDLRKRTKFSKKMISMWNLWTDLEFQLEVQRGVFPQRSHHGLEGQHALDGGKTGLHQQPATQSAWRKWKSNIATPSISPWWGACRQSPAPWPHALFQSGHIGCVLHVQHAGGQDGQALLVKVVESLLRMVGQQSKEQVKNEKKKPKL